MRFSVFMPAASSVAAVPAVYFLAGLTCTEETFMIKAGAQRVAAALGLALITPDTSPRQTGIDGATGDWEFGEGAGFYLDARTPQFVDRFRMRSYVADELPTLIGANFNIDPQRCGISGHSMGGHGALTLGLCNSLRFRSISAFAPIVAPASVPWGEKAFSRYLGDDRAVWNAYDATALVAKYQHPSTILIDQGLDDAFLERQLRPELFEAACHQHGQSLQLRRHAGYDHSYWFIQSFIEEHLRHHARILG